MGSTKKAKKNLKRHVQKLWLRYAIPLGLACVLALGAALSWNAGTLYRFNEIRTGEKLPWVSVIVCLSGGRGRIRSASDLWYSYWQAWSQEAAQSKNKKSSAKNLQVPHLFISGMGSHESWNAFRQQVRPEVLAVLKPEIVILESQSLNTVENAQVFKNYAAQYGWNSLLLTTSSYHMRRAMLIFETILNQSSSTPFEIYSYAFYRDPFRLDRWYQDLYGIRVTFLEYIKWLYYEHLWKYDS